MGKLKLAEMTMKKKMTEYFGNSEIPLQRPEVRFNLEFDNNSVDNISAMVFKGMRSGSNQSDTLTRDDLRVWTKAIMVKKHPNLEFDEKAFEKGFQSLDQDKDGI